MANLEITNIWDDEEPLNEYLDIEIPDWISDNDASFSPHHVAAIYEGGCASGAFMPAVTYFTANQTMYHYGDEVLDFIAGHLGEIPKPNNDTSWTGMSVFYLSYAVELFASDVMSQLEDLTQ